MHVLIDKVSQVIRLPLDFRRDACVAAVVFTHYANFDECC